MINESNIRALVLLNLLNSLRKRDKMLGKPRILSLFPNLFNKFINRSTHVRSNMNMRDKLTGRVTHYYLKYLDPCC